MNEGLESRICPLSLSPQTILDSSGVWYLLQKKKGSENRTVTSSDL